tara:strand:- start:304 stop:519 length:216 start_codon:yes stop_codon:yes gene_type:complete
MINNIQKFLEYSSESSNLKDYSIIISKRRINNGSIFKIKPKKQKKSLLIRYTKKVDLNTKAIEEYNKKKLI